MVGGGGLESDFSVHLWSKALAEVGTKLNNIVTSEVIPNLVIKFTCYLF